MLSPPQKKLKEAMIFVSMKNGKEMLADWKRSQWEFNEIHIREDQGEKHHLPGDFQRGEL